MRDREVQTITAMRSKFPAEFALAEDTLGLAERIFGQSRRIANPESDVLLGRLTIALLMKVVHVFWAIIVLAERALPSSSMVRELAEAVISLAYLLKEDSVERAQLYRDHMIIRDLKDMNRRFNEPDSRDVVTPEYRALVERNVAALVARRTQRVFKAMKDWPTWGGNFSIEAMAKKAAIPGSFYTLLYAAESRAPHAMDLSSHITLTPTGDIAATLPAQAERHLMPSTALVLMAFHVGTQALQLGHADEIEVLHQRLQRISGVAEEPGTGG